MATCQNCNAFSIGGIKQGNLTFCSKKCQNAYTPIATSVTCGKCGTVNALHRKKCKECDDYLHQYKAPEHTGQAKCPNCSERVAADATLCPACKNPIYSQNKQTNALIAVVMFFVMFFGLYYFFTAFTEHEADRQMQKYQKQADQEYNRMMKNIQRDLDQLK